MQFGVIDWSRRTKREILTINPKNSILNQYQSNVSWQSLETWTTRLDPWSSKLEHFEDRGSSQVLRRSRPFENLSSWVLRLSSRVSKLLSGKIKDGLTLRTVQYRSKVSYHSLILRESRLARRDTRLARRDFRLARRDSRLVRALRNCKYGCLNFSRDFYSLL